MGLIGLAHLPFARPLLYLIKGSCPAGFDQIASPEVQDAARAQILPTVQGDSPAAARPALGFVLDQDKAEDLRAWASAHNLSCQERGPSLVCGPVPAGVVDGQPALSELSFHLDGRGLLIAVSASMSNADAQEAVGAVKTTTEALSAAVGPPVLSRGQPDPEWLAGGPMKQYSSEFRFSDYRAQLMATNMGQDRIAVRLVFQSLAAPKG